jgi:hypothetical protein
VLYDFNKGETDEQQPANIYLNAILDQSIKFKLLGSTAFKLYLIKMFETVIIHKKQEA